jgi:hypothetical protein
VPSADAWAAVLDELERALTEDQHGDWLPPTGLGPLPAELAPRAEALLAAQRAAIAAGQSELERIGREIGELRRPAVPRALEERPVYIDTLA